METEPIWDIAHLAHVELLTPKPNESLHFFTEIMGMRVSAQQGDSVYLRAYDDYEHHTLKLTAAKQPGMKHFAWRARCRRIADVGVAHLGAFYSSEGRNAHNRRRIKWPCYHR